MLKDCPFLITAFHAAHRNHELESKEPWLKCHSDNCVYFVSGLVDVHNNPVEGMCCVRLLAVKNDKGQVIVLG